MRRASKVWIGIGLALLAVGGVLYFVFFLRAMQHVPGDPARVGSAPVRLAEPGINIWASRRPSEPAACVVTGPSGTPVELTRFAGKDNYTTDSGTWYLVYRSAAEVPAGSYTVSCSGGDPAIVYAAGPRDYISDFLRLIALAIASAVVPGLAGVAIIAVTLIRHRRRPPGSVTAAGSQHPGGQGHGRRVVPGTTRPDS